MPCPSTTCGSGSPVEATANGRFWQTLRADSNNPEPLLAGKLRNVSMVARQKSGRHNVRTTSDNIVLPEEGSFGSNNSSQDDARKLTGTRQATSISPVQNSKRKNVVADLGSGAGYFALNAYIASRQIGVFTTTWDDQHVDNGLGRVAGPRPGASRPHDGSYLISIFRNFGKPFSAPWGPADESILLHQSCRCLKRWNIHLPVRH